MPLMHVGTTLNAAGGSHPGLLRPNNEDRFHCDPGRGLFIVVDGVGGQAAGEKAAETALAIVRTRLERETGPIEDRIREAITLANNEIYRLASTRAEWRGMACVLTLVVVSNGDVVVGHVGDTRLYKLRGGRIEKLTRDHAPVGEREDAGELSELEAMQHPRRNEVYRDVGSEPHDPDDPEFIEVFRQPLEPDAALVLCSDGLTDQIESAAINEVVADYAGHPFEVVRGLIDAANAAGGKDNVTVVYAEGPAFTHGEDTRDLRRRRHAASDPSPAISVPVENTRSNRQTGTGRWRVATLVLLLLGVAAVAGYLQRDRLRDVSRSWLRHDGAGGTTVPAVVRVGPNESIADAIMAAVEGTEVLVEPGEYREQIRLKTGVRVVSRAPRSAVLRLPAGASESDAAIVAFEVSDATLSGFRIEGDAATPLGTGIILRNSNVTLSDIEITGARSAAIEYSGTAGGSVIAADLHDNPGAAIVIRSGASPRIAHSTFVRNAESEHIAGTLLVEAAAHPVLTNNTFYGISPDSLIASAGFARSTLTRDNWFVNPPPEHPATAPARSGGGRR